jgi:magnesium chelatase subunit D
VKDAEAPADEASPAAKAWADAALSAALLAVAPWGCGGVQLRASAGPVRDAWLALLTRLLGADTPPLRVPLGIRDDRLLGGLDLTATLRTGRPVAEPGLLARADGRVLLAAMAERLSPGTAARLASVLDRGELAIEREGFAAVWPARLAVVALDEGAQADEHAPAALAERLAIWLDLGALPPRVAAEDFGLDALEIAAARARLPGVRAEEGVIEALCGVAAQLGIDSLRAPMLALAVARRHAALAGRDTVDHDDAVVAARLVLAPRATRLPAPEEPPAPPPDAEAPPPPPSESPPETPPEPPVEGEGEERPLEDQVLEAAVAALPPDLLARLKAAEAGRTRGDDGKAGDWQRGTTRGRPAGVKRGEPRAGQRLDLIETLRAAAPWQRLRRSLAADAAGAGAGPLIRVRPEDFHVRRYRQRRSTTTIFVVDASGSSALHRLAEAKGAVELLLADCYVRRDRVAVLAFRGRAAELLLPPTRSLVRAKRGLAGLPGGGGTPLASAVDAAADIVRAVKRRGETPVLVLLTDGRANVARDGTGGRARAEQEALASARSLAAEGVATLVVDTSPQPQAAASALAAALRATYLPLPHAGAAALSGVVAAHARGRA